MTQPPYSPGAADKVPDLLPDLHPVSFQPVQDDDGRLAVYRAFVRDPDEPGMVASLTVTTASPADSSEKREFEEFLGQIRAGFAHLEQPDPGEPVDEEPEPFNPDAEILFAPEAADSAPQEPVGVALVVQTTIGSDAAATTAGNGAAENRIGNEVLEARVVIRPGDRDHRWVSITGRSEWATLDVVGGNGTIRYPPEGVAARNRYRRYRQVLTVHAIRTTTYYMYGPFRRR
jgi:hypothetical protein